MDVKEYLSLIDRSDRRIQYKLNELYRLKVLATSIGATANDDVRVQSSRTGGKLEDTMVKLYDLETEINSLIDDMVDTRKVIIKQIENMPNINQSSVLIERYVEHKPFEDIADSLGYSRKQINRIHGEALVQFERMYGDEIKTCPTMSHNVP